MTPSTLEEKIGYTSTRVDIDTPAVKPEKNRMPISFMIAGGLHFLLLAGGGLGFIAHPEYGMQSSSASMEVYMVAALPDYAEKPAVKAQEQELVSDLLFAKSDMEVAVREKKKEISSGSQKPDALQASKAKASAKSKVKGDGSSAEPGQSATTFFSLGSSEAAGKDGKYQNPPPQYPYLAERNGWEGVVLLKVHIEKEGRPAQVLVEKSSGYEALDDAALKAVKDWRFTAGRIGNMEVASWIKIPIRFELQKKPAA